MKNYLPYPYYSSSKTINGVTFDIQDDGTIILNGTATTAIYYRLYHDIGATDYYKNNLAGKTYIISTGTHISGLNLIVEKDYSNIFITNIENQFTFPQSFSTYLYIIIEILSGVVLNNVVFKPMIRPVGTSNEYISFSKTNLDITKEIFYHIPISVQSDKSYEDIKFYRTGNVLKIYINGIKFVTGNQVICTVPDGFDLENNYAGKQQDYQYGDARLRFSIYDSQLSVYNYYSSDINDTNVRILLIF